MLFFQQVNIVLVSDHGMVTVIEEDGEQKAKVIEIETIVDPNDIVVMFDRGTTSMLLPVKGKEQKVRRKKEKFPNSIFTNSIASFSH